MDLIKRSHGTLKVPEILRIEIKRGLVRKTLRWRIENTTNCWSIYRKNGKRRESTGNRQNSLSKRKDKYLKQIKE